MYTNQLIRDEVGILNNKNSDKTPNWTDAVGLDIGAIVAILLRRRWVIAIVCALVFALGALTTMRSPKIYRATTTLEIEKSVPDTYNSSGNVDITKYMSDEMIQDYRELKSKILWKILFLKRKIERISQNSVPDNIPKINERRLRSDLVKAEIILEIINSQILMLDDLWTEFFKLERTYDQRMKISNVSELSDYEYI